LTIRASRPCCSSLGPFLHADLPTTPAPH
jgi:hypothetical protein